MNIQGYDPDVLKERLRKLRENEGLRMYEVGQAIGVSGAAISGYETGIRQPLLVNILMLAEYYGVTVEYLVGREDLLERSKGGERRGNQVSSVS